MIDNLLMVPLPIIDHFFGNWGITPNMSKVALLFAILGSALLAHVTNSLKIVFFPISLVVLLLSTALVNYYLHDMLGSNLTPFVKMIVAAGVGQTMGACVLMAIFKTGEVSRSS